MFANTSLTTQVRQSCESVIEHAHLLEIRDEGLDLLAEICKSEPTLVASPAATPLLSSPEVASDFAEGLAMRSLAANAINFGSGYHDLVRKLPGHSGARTMNVRLARYFDATGAPDAKRLLGFTSEDCSQIFGQELDGGALEELMGRFAQGLRDLGEFVTTHGGSARAVLDRCEQSAVALAEMLTSMPFYRDVEMMEGVSVSFYKRAQITPADLAREGLWHFNDLHELTAFADNLVPHVLRVDGVIVADPGLVEKIDRGTLLTPGSREEIELRAAAVVAVERLLQRIGAPKLRPMDLDAWLWSRGGGARYKAHPRPRSRSVFY